MLALGGLVSALTLLASPKLGPRLYFASVALIAAGLVGWLVDRLREAPVAPATGRAAWWPGRWIDAWAARGCAIVAAGVLAYVEIRLVAIHRVVGPLGAIRAERIEHAPAGAAVTVPRYPYPRSRYFLGDDLLDPGVRDVLAREFHLGSVALEPAAP